MTDNLVQLKEKYSSVYQVQVKGEIFTFRPLLRREYRELMERDQGGEMGLEEAVCRIAVIEPKDYDFGKRGKAGLAKIVSENIIAASGLAHPGQVQAMLDSYREEMRGFEAQAETFITQAFKVSLEEMQEWPLEKLMKYLARAEWALQNIWQLPVSFEPPEEGDEEEPAEPPSMREIGEQMRQQGLDPMMELAHIIRKKPSFVEFPMIGGTNLLKNEEALYHVGEQVQRLSTRRHLPSTLPEE